MFRALVAALEVDFVEEVEVALKDVWERLRADGHPAPGGDGRPHISLAAGLGLASVEVVEALRAAVGGSLASAPEELSLDRIGWFPGEEQVVFLAPVPSGVLVDWHLALWPIAHRAFVDPVAYYAPGEWIPHCTMRAGPGPAVDETVAWLRREVKLPIVARIDGVALRLYENGLRREIWSVSERV